MIKETIAAIIGAICFIAVGAYITQPMALTGKELRLSYISTDKATTYPTQTSTGRCNFVEMVADPHAAQYAARR